MGLMSSDPTCQPPNPYLCFFGRQNKKVNEDVLIARAGVGAKTAIDRGKGCAHQSRGKGRARHRSKGCACRGGLWLVGLDR